MSEFQKIVHNDTLGVKPLYLTIDATNTPYQLKPGDTCVIATTALADAAAIILPAICLLSSVISSVELMWSFGISKICTGACGVISLNARISSSS